MIKSDICYLVCYNYSQITKTTALEQTNRTNVGALTMPLWGWIFILFWFYFVLQNYFMKHPLYRQSVLDVGWSIVAVHVGLLAVGFAVATWYQKSKGKIHGRLIYLLFFINMLVTGISLVFYYDLSISISEVGFFVFNLLKSIAILLFVLFSAFALGKSVIDLFDMRQFENWGVIGGIALGLPLINFVAFALLVMGWFNLPLIIIIFLVPVIFYLFKHKSNIKDSLPKMMLDKLAPVEILILLMIILLNSLTCLDTFTAMPRGFDAMNYYANIPNLLLQEHTLVEGFQPYNWSILQACMGALGGMHEILMGSWMGLLLLQLALYQFGKHVLNLKPELLLAAILLTTALPSVLVQSSAEFKVDLGLTFMFVIVLQLSNELARDLSKNKNFALNRDILFPVIALGVMFGFCMGIKLTTISLLLVVIAFLWYVEFGLRAGVASMLIALGLVFFLNFDSVSGMDLYHHSKSWLRFVAIAIGFALLVLEIKAEPQKAKRLVVITAVIVLTTLLVFSPWMIKHVYEIEHPSLMQILNGTDGTSNINNQ